jgi:hypothetical protein
VVHHWSEALGAVGAALPTLVDFVAGILTGAVVLGAWSTVQRVRGKSAH